MFKVNFFLLALIQIKNIPVQFIVQNAVLHSNLINRSTPFNHGLLHSVQIILGHLLPQGLLHFQRAYYRPDLSSDPRKKSLRELGRGMFGPQNKPTTPPILRSPWPPSYSDGSWRYSQNGEGHRRIGTKSSP